MPQNESSPSSNRDLTQKVFHEIGMLSKEELVKRYTTLAWGYINQSETAALQDLFARLERGREIGPRLDLGCGTGRLLLPLSRRYSVTGLDFSKSFLEQLKAMAPEIEAVYGEATELPFKDASFSTVLCVRLIQHLTRKEQKLFFDEARRVLKPGGVLIVLNYNALSWLTLYKKLCQALGGLWPHWPLRKWNWQVDDYHFSWELNSMFRHHGFRVVESIACTPGEPDMDRFLKLDTFALRKLFDVYYGALMQVNGWGRHFPFSRLFSRVIVAGEKK